MAGKKQQQPDLIKTAFDLIAENGWRALALSGIAARADLPLSQVQSELGSKGRLIRKFADRMDQATFATPMSEMAELTSKERLFELLMRRFDALKPFKPAFTEVERRRELDCLARSVLFCNLDRLAERLLDACESSAHGLRRKLARRLLMAVYAKVFSVWLKDDTEDLATTMSELDKRLGQLETLTRFSNPFGRRQRHQAAPEAGEA